MAVLRVLDQSRNDLNESVADPLRNSVFLVGDLNLPPVAGELFKYAAPESNPLDISMMTGRAPASAGIPQR